MADKYIQNMLAFSDQLQGEKEYWLAKLSGITEFTGFPVDFYPRADSPAGKRQPAAADFNFPEPLSMRLFTISNQSPLRVFVLLLCGINYLLYRYTGNEDLIMGIPVMRQKNGATSPVNNLVSLRIMLSGHTPFKELLAQMRQTVNDAVKHQNYPFSKLAELLNWQNLNSEGEDGAFEPILPVIAALENLHDSSVIDDIIAARENSLVFQFKMREQLISCSLKYAPGYAPSTVARIWDHLLKFLDTVAQNPQISLAEIDILDAAEREQILYEFNKTGQKYPKEKTIHELFEEQAARTPDNIALVFKDHTRRCIQLTYRELNHKANQLAGVLRKKGIGPDKIVGIMVERSLEMLIGILGVLKAGGAYLPIDPQYPEERIKYMLEDSKTAILLTQNCQDSQGVQGSLAQKTDFKGESISVDDAHIYNTDVTNLENINTAMDPAYVIYTSGSTGKPKGVIIVHQAVHNFITGVSRVIDFKPAKSILCLTTISFDIFVLETLLPLSSGMKVIIASEAEQRDPKLLIEMIIETRIDMLQVTPSRLKFILETDQKLDCLEKVSEIMIGGEALLKDLLESLQERYHQKIYNMYGPTETTVWSAIKDLSGEKEISIGKPIANTQIYILDKANRLQPVGIAGELCIAGDGLARGYLNNPELTAEKFVPNPFVDVDASPNSVDASRGTRVQRIYKTGDLARWLPDGNIEYLGRIDHQVKLRGFRIELGEIENQLLKHPSIREAVVVAREEMDGSNQLCAYFTVVAGDMHACSPQELRDHLLKKLPGYMIPAYFIQLELLPLTPNGKINRKALPKPDEKMKRAGATGVVYVAPRNEIEEKIVKIWQEILGIEKIGVNDNFFDLGGDSFKAIRVIGRLNEYSINVMSIMEHPTIAELQVFMTKLNDGREDFPPVMAENLGLEYFFLRNGEPDPIATFLDCNGQMIYFTLKKKVKNYHEYIGLLLQDIVFYIVQNPDGSIYDINLLGYPYRGDILGVNYKEGQGYQVMSEIEKLLDQGEQVVLGTCARRVPFHKDFEGFDTPYLPITKGHTFLVVAHNDTDLYYVEIPSVLNAAYFVQYPKNKSIGIIKKTDLKAAFEAFVDYGTIMINESNLNQASNLKGLTQLTLDNYSKEIFYQDNFKISYGKNALDLLIELSEKECLSLDHTGGLYNTTNIFHLFEWKFYAIGSRRKILRDVLAGYTQECNMQAKNNLINILDRSYTGWFAVQEFIKRRFLFEKENLFGREYQSILLDLKAMEQEIMQNLAELWNS